MRKMLTILAIVLVLAGLSLFWTIPMLTEFHQSVPTENPTEQSLIPPKTSSYNGNNTDFVFRVRLSENLEWFDHRPEQHYAECRQFAMDYLQLNQGTGNAIIAQCRQSGSLTLYGTEALQSIWEGMQ